MPALDEPNHVPAHLKTRLVINDARRVQARVTEEALGCIRLSLNTDGAQFSLMLGETAIRSLAAQFAEAVARLDAHSMREAVA